MMKKEADQFAARTAAWLANYLRSAGAVDPKSAIPWYTIAAVMADTFVSTRRNRSITSCGRLLRAGVAYAQRHGTPIISVGDGFMLSSDWAPRRAFAHIHIRTAVSILDKVAGVLNMKLVAVITAYVLPIARALDVAREAEGSLPLPLGGDTVAEEGVAEKAPEL